jgi:hypothetical protein
MKIVPTVCFEKRSQFSAEDLAELSRWASIAGLCRYELILRSEPETGEFTPIGRAENGDEFILIELCEPQLGANPNFTVMRTEGRWIVEDRLCEIMRSYASLRESLEGIFSTF